MLRKPKEENNFCIKQGGLFLSNSIEVLFEQLKINFFALDNPIFSDRMLLVPSMWMQQWIQTQMASSFSISCGFTATFLNKGIDSLCEKLFCAQKERDPPSQFELCLRLYQEIRVLLSSQEPLWQPLVSYVEGKETRILSLAEILSQLFLKYGIYGNGLTLNWEKNPSNWQEALWAKIFSEWEYPFRAFLNRQTQVQTPSSLSVHLFAFSHISPLHLRFFCQVSEHIPVYVYQLSPCQEFWSDLTTDHPNLLGSLGKVGREMAKWIEVSECDTDPAYLQFGGDTQLRRLQRSLLTLQEMEPVTDDDSLQLHIGITPHQEIETLHHILYDIFKQGGIEPKDVIVMAPQIAHYAPYIQAIFNDLPYQIADMPAHTQDPLASGLFLLLDLEKRRWCAPAVLELFHHPLFQKKWGITEEECRLISTWVQKTGIYWGVNAAHRAEMLKKEHCSQDLVEDRATWMQGLGFLLEELALPSEDPLIHFSQAELLGKVLHVITALHKDLKALDTSKTLLEWVQAFKTLVETYFTFENPEKLASAWSKMERAARHFPETPFSFTCALHALKEAFGDENLTANRHLVQAVRFCSMLPMRALPAKVICILGMQHDAFPRKEEFRALDLLKDHPQAEYSPSRLDFDRYIFLEALLSAREKLIISYIGRDPIELTEMPPSSCVAELLPYISKHQVKIHPGYDLSRITVKPWEPFSIQIKHPFTLPQGEFTIDSADLGRLVRSPIAHYCAMRDIKIAQTEMHGPDEPFSLSPLKKAILRKEALRRGHEEAIKRGEKLGAFPLGLLGKVAQKQLQEETLLIGEAEMTSWEIKPFIVEFSSSLTVRFTGIVEGVGQEGMWVTDKFSLKNAVRAWHSFLLLNVLDSSKQEIYFALSGERKTVFFEDPIPLLKKLAEFYFYASEQPFYFALDWIEPILKKEAKKLLTSPVYDPYLQWQLSGKRAFDAESVIELYAPLLESVYGEMMHAWC